jgi:hypothetical protein
LVFALKPPNDVKWFVVPVTVRAIVFTLVGTASHVLPLKNATSVGGVPV